MQIHMMGRLGPAGGSSPFSSPASALPLPFSLVEQENEWVRRTLTKTRLEETVGTAFLVITLTLSGWFYYLLYQALCG
jgi:hypothetical protein